MNSTMKQILIWNGHAWTIFHVPWNFEIFVPRQWSWWGVIGMGLFMIGLDQVCCKRPLEIKYINLKFDGVRHSTMKQIIYQNDHAWPIIVISFEMFHDKLIPGLRNDISALTLYENHISTWRIFLPCISISFSLMSIYRLVISSWLPISQHG